MKTSPNIDNVRAIMSGDEITPAQLATLRQSGSLCGPDPEPSGHRDGVPYWSRQDFLDWSEKTKRSRGRPLGMSTRGMIATLVGREKKAKQQSQETADDLAFAIATGKLKSVDKAEARCEELGIAPSDLAGTVKQIEGRISRIAEIKRQGEAKSEVRRLEAEIDLANAEWKEAKAPIQARIDQLYGDLDETKKAATKVPNAQRGMRDSAPQWLQDEYEQTQSDLQSVSKESSGLDNGIQTLGRDIDGTRELMHGLPGRIEMLARNVADFEGNAEATALRQQKERLDGQLGGLNLRLKTVKADRKKAQHRESELRNREEKIASLMTEVWPRPSDLTE